MQTQHSSNALSSDKAVPDCCGFGSNPCRIPTMNFWRSHRRQILILSLVLAIFILLFGPMRTKVYEQSDDSGSLISGLEEKQRESQNQGRPLFDLDPELGIDDKPEVKVRNSLGTSLGGKAETETKIQQLDTVEPVTKAAVKLLALPVKKPEPIVQVKNPNMWQKHLRKECERVGMYDPLTEENFNKALFKHILVDDKHKVIYCQIPKVATITWRRIFIVSTGLANTTDPKALAAVDIYGKYDKILQYLSDLSLEEIKYRLRHYFKFVFVREPMERLLSAYRNKMVQKMASSDYFRKVLGRKIALEYRSFSDTEKLDPEEPEVKFQEFAQYLIDHNRKIQWNEHWDKYHQLCFPCKIPYDFVGKLEFAQRDANYILRRTGLDEIALFPNRTDTNYKLEETKNILKQHYSTLTRSDLRNLMKEYETDRRLFNYKIPEVLNDILHPQ